MASTSSYPSRYEDRVTLKDGRKVFIRPVKETDEELVVDLFNRLSPRSLYLRFLRNFHDVPRDMLSRLIHINYTSEFALAAIIWENEMDAAIAIARYGHTPGDDMADLAVAVRDDWQGLRIGSLMLSKIVEIGRENGIYRYGGLMEADNRVIRHVLAELGYRVSYTLKGGFYQVDISV